jgi:hypothetical protein
MHTTEYEIYEMQFAIKENMTKSKAVTLNAEQLELLKNWYEQDNQLKAIKKTEFTLRQQVVNKCGFDPAKLEGSQTLDIGGGWKLKAIKVQTYKVENDKGEAMVALNIIGGATGANRPDLAQRLVDWKPMLSVTTYKEIQPLIDQIPGLKEALSAAITIKPGSPQLELVAPEVEEVKTA